MGVDLEGVKALRQETGLGFVHCKKALDEAEGNREQAIILLRKKGMAAADRRAHRAADQGMIALYISPEKSSGALVEMRCETDFVARGDDFIGLASELAKLAGGLEPGKVEKEMFLGQSAGAGKGSVQDEVKTLGGRVGEKVEMHRVASLPPPGTDRHRVGGYVHHNGKSGALVRIGYKSEATGATLDEVLKNLAMHIVAHVPPPVAVSKDDVPEEVVEKERAIQADTDEIKKKPEKIRGKILEGKMQRFLRDLALLEQPLVTVTDGKVPVREVLEKHGKDLSDSLVVEGFLRFELGGE
ncbi:MAG: translation elongation factor Ts [Planctomycetota bacterium]|nr:translation elongation factor Ts [Planctomycetota bacterium]